MPKTIYSPSDTRKNFYQLLKGLNKDYKKIQIFSEVNGNNVVLISLEDWSAEFSTIVGLFF